MKASTLIVVCAVASIIAVYTEAQMILPPVPPIMPAFGALPFLGLGGLGGMGLGLGLGLGMGPLGFGGLAFRRLALLGMLGRKKRDISGVTGSQINCTISNQADAILCNIAHNERLICEIEPRLNGIPEIKLRLIDLFVTENKNERVLSLLSPKWTATSTPYTFLEPVSRKPALISLYSDAAITKPGFLFKERVCFDAFWDVIKGDLSNVRVDLIVA